MTVNHDDPGCFNMKLFTSFNLSWTFPKLKQAIFQKSKPEHTPLLSELLQWLLCYSQNSPGASWVCHFTLLHTALSTRLRHLDHSATNGPLCPSHVLFSVRMAPFFLCIWIMTAKCQLQCHFCRMDAPDATY